MKEEDRNERRELPLGSSMMLGILTVASFLIVLDYASIIIPLPAILEDFGGSLDKISWVVAAFVLTFAVLLHPCARLADTYGHRRIFLIGTAVFVAASFTCAIAPTLEFLIGARCLLGAGAAAMEAAAYRAINDTFTGEARKRSVRVQSIAFLLGGALAPLLSGAITSALSWEYIFWLDGLIGLAVLIAAFFVLQESRSVAARRDFDMLGLICAGGGLFLLVFGLIEGPRFGWVSVPTILSFAGAAILLPAFAFVETNADEALIPPALLRDRFFMIGNGLRALVEFASLGIFFALSHFMQAQLGYSALVTGLLIMSVIGGALASASAAETLVGRIDIRWLVVPGFLVMVAGIFWTANVSFATEWAFFLMPLALFGAGIGILEAPLDRAKTRAVPASQEAAAWRASYTFYLTGIALGVAAVAAVWQGRLLATGAQILARYDLPPEQAERVNSLLLAYDGKPGAFGAAGNQALELFLLGAVPDAINAALLTCAIAGLAGAAAALFPVDRNR